jgi:4'-phosphopantetheinyl transferase
MRIYICNIQAFFDLRGIDLVTDTRRERIYKYRQVADKARCLVAGLLMRRMCGVTDDKQLEIGKNGKPHLKDSDIFFNVSHSGDYVVLATANNEVGVDIEKMDSFSDKVAAYCLLPEEYEWLQNEACNEAFYYLWTAKESVMKASGKGFSLSPKKFSVLPIDSSAHCIDGKNWFLDWLPHDGHMICRAVEKEDEITEFTEVFSNDLL